MSGPDLVSVPSVTRVRRRRGWSRKRVIMAIAVIVVVLAATVFGLTEGRALWHKYQDRPTADSHPAEQGQLNNLQPVANPADNRNGRGTAPEPSSIPATTLLQVPYTVQAPGNNWKEFENACEEDAVFMDHLYVEGDKRGDVPVPEATDALRAMEKWQVVNWGAEKDLTLEKTGQFAKAYYGYNYRVFPATKESIEQELAAGRPVIIPVMTHSLENHNYGAQTVYHEVLIKGYTDAGVVTNDGGIWQGKNWFYSWKIVFQAIDAQTPKLNQGRLALVLTK
ncbi:MAG: C39 family peptidase [Candidatus Dormiibacterota bacterium]